MKKIAPLFFILCLALGVGIFIWTARHPSAPAPTPTLAPKHPTVSIQKGPLKLTLTLYSDTVPRNGPLWFRLSVTNIGKKPFFVSDPIFARKFLRHGSDFIDYLGDNHEKKTGFYLVVLDAAGHEVEQYEKPLIDYDVCGGYDPFKFASRSEIRKYQDREEKKKNISQGRDVSPGQSLETIAWSYRGFCRKGSPHPPSGILGSRPNLPTPPGRFAEFYGLDLSKPGYYRVYAVLNDEPDEEAKRFFRQYGEKESPAQVSTKTPLIRFEVLRCNQFLLHSGYSSLLHALPFHFTRRNPIRKKKKSRRKYFFVLGPLAKPV